MKQIRWMLEKLEGFEKPKIKLEQYATSAELAVSMMELIDDDVGLDGAVVADVGCGCGMLMTTIAACYEPSLVLGIDVDDDALAVCSRNLQSAEVEDVCDLMKADAMQLEETLRDRFDVVVINPPFGTKNNAGIDMKFVKAGLTIVRPGGSVFSLHKSSTRDYILKTTNKWPGVESECCAEMRWKLDATYKFHKQKSVDINVDVIKFTKS